MLDTIGFFAPQILLLTSIFILRNKMTLLSIYLFGFFINSIVNYILKGLFRDARPSEDIHLFNIEKTHSNSRIGFDRYGMPSGHAQSVFYSTTFIYFASQNITLLLFYLAISFNSLRQRYHYKNHTMVQLFFGGILGFLLGYIFYTCNPRDTVKDKPDDDAHI